MAINRVMDVDARKAASNFITRPVALIIGPKEPTQEAMDRILAECCYKPLQELGPCGTLRLQAYDAQCTVVSVPAPFIVHPSSPGMMVLLTHIMGDMPAIGRMLGRRGHRCKTFCHRCTREYDDFSDVAEAKHQTHEEYVAKALNIEALARAWATAAPGDAVAAKKELDDARGLHGINLHSSIHHYLGYVDIMYTVHTALMHCVLYGVVKTTIELAFNANAIPEGVRHLYQITST